MLVPDTVLQNRYRIVRQLGQGGMGTVFEAVDERLDTTVALKETLFADERLRKQFEREARLLARLHHPALPRVSDHFTEAEGQFLVMQYIGGEDLAEMITKRRGPFPVDQVLLWAEQLLDALDYLHTQEPQIIHRDIKPQNLKLTARGQIILLDFGLAKGQASEISRITTAASIFGYTPNYAPLEQVQGLGTDPRSDIYSLSATIYHLLTGERPPDALTRAAAIVNGQPDPLKPANELNAAVTAETAAVLQKAMSQNREQRYLTAAAMRKALQGGDSGITLTNRSEANTVLFPTPTPVAAARTEVNAQQPTVGPKAASTELPGETTVVRDAQPKPKSFAARFAAPIGAVVILIVGACCLYLYHGSQSASDAALNPAPEPTPVVQPSAPPEQNASEEPKQEQAKEAVKPQSDSATAKKEKTATPREKPAAKDQEESEQTIDEELRKAEKELEKLNDIKVPGVPAPAQRPIGVQRVGGVTIRTFPDGSQMIIQPNGKRTLVRPDGTTQVVTPARPNRRRPPPTP